MTQQIQALLVTKGHPFHREPFFQMIEALRHPDPDTEITWTHVEHPAAEAVLTVENAARYDAIVFYDMPGIAFANHKPPFAQYDPSPTFKDNFMALLDAGQPMIFLHHAIAGWPTWPEYADIVGGRFHFQPGELRGTTYPGSGYRFRVDQTITVENPGHPIVKGLPAQFPFREEAYLMVVFEDDVTPLLRSDFAFEAANFRYGGIGFQHHPTGSNLIGWTKTYRNAPIAYLQPAHEHLGYEDPYFRKLLGNAVIWAADEKRRHHTITPTDRRLQTEAAQ